MKNIYLLFVIASIAFISNSSLHPSGNTGAPGDSFCGGCHSGSGGALDGEIIITGLPANIQPSTTYSITVTVTNPAQNAARAGFQILALDDNNNNVGTFSNWPSNAELRMQSGRSYLGHKPAQLYNGQSQVTWTADWTSPSSGSGDITIYGAAVIANGSSGNNGDRAVLTNESGTFSGGSNPLTLTVTEDKPTSCFDTADGWATANPAGGTPPYSYLWDTGETTKQAIFLDGGTHSVTVTDDANNTVSEQVFINSPTEILVIIDNQSDALCFGDNSGTASISANGGTPGYIFDWSDGGTGSNRNDLAAGNYTVTVRDQNGCEKDQFLTIGEPPELTAFEIIEDASCAGDSDGAISITPDGGVQNYSYQWSNGSTDQNINNLSSGTYGLTLTDGNNCSVSFQYNVDEPLPLSITVINTQDASCNGASDGFAEILGEGGTGPYTYSWSDGGSGAIRNDLASGSYTVIIADENECENSINLTINEPAGIVIDSISSIPASCPGVTDGSLTVEGNGGAGQFTYQWSSGDTGPIANNLSSGIYFVTATDQNNCSNEVQLTLGALSEASLTLQSSANNQCFGDSTGSASVNIANGADYEIMWSNGETGSTVTNLPANTYTVIATNPSGCESNQIEIIITQPSAIVINELSVNMPDCFGDDDGSIEVLAEGGTGSFTYLWSNGAQESVIEGLEPGDYTVEVTDENQCTSTTTITIIEPQEISLDSFNQENLLCFGDSTGQISVAFSGGTGVLSYLWSTGETSPTITDLFNGEYIVTTIDENNCERADTFEILNPSQLVLNGDVMGESESGANDGSIIIEISGGTPNYNILWSNGESGDTLMNLSPGNYTVEIIDANGCMVTQSYTVSDGDCTLDATAATNNVSCFGFNDGSILIEFTGNNGDIEIILNPNLPLDSLVAGTYTLEVVDTAGCSVLIENLTITEPEPLIITIDTIMASDNTNNGSVEITPKGGTGPFEYIWTDSNGNVVGNEQDLLNIPPGSYNLNITDANGCSITSDVYEVTFVSSLNTIEEESFSVYPNPANTILFVEHEQTINMIKLIGLNGKTVKEISTNKSIVKIDVTGLVEGMYILQLFTNENRQSEKIFIRQ